MCPLHGFTFHPNFIGASGLLSALIELTFQKRTLLQESGGTSRRRHPTVGAFTGVYTGIIQRFKRKEAALVANFITW